VTSFRPDGAGAARPLATPALCALVAMVSAGVSPGGATAQIAGVGASPAVEPTSEGEPASAADPLELEAGPGAQSVEGPERSGGAVDVRGELASRVAEAWEASADAIRIELPTDLPAAIDSLSATEGSGVRWIVTLWSDGRTIRRFARAGTVRTVSVAARSMPRDHALEPEDIGRAERIVWGPPPPPFDLPDGWVTQRRIRAGEVLERPAVRPPLLIRGGDPVKAVLKRSGVVLTVFAEALSSARKGEPVSVRMPSGRRMDGRALASGVVALNPGGSR